MHENYIGNKALFGHVKIRSVATGGAWGAEPILVRLLDPTQFVQNRGEILGGGDVGATRLRQPTGTSRSILY